MGIEGKKFLLTILILTRTISLNKDLRSKIKPDYESITKPSGMNKIIPTGFIKEFCKTYKLNSNKPAFKEEYLYLSNKAGPNGKATLSALSNIINYDTNEINYLKSLTDAEGSTYIDEQLALG